MNIDRLFDELDRDVSQKFKTQQISSVVLPESNKILYFNHLGQPIVEYIIREFGPRVILEEFSYKNKLGKGE